MRSNTITSGKTLVICGRYPLPEDNGSSMRTMNFVRFFRQYGQVDIAYSGPSAREDNGGGIFAKSYRLNQNEALPAGFRKRLIRLFRIRRIPLPVRPFDRESERSLLSVIEKEGYDYILVRYADNASVLFKLAEKYRKRTIVDFDDIVSGSLYYSQFDSVQGLHKRFLARLNRIFLTAYELNCLRFGAALFCSTNDREQFAVRTGRTNLYVVQNVYANKSFEDFDFGDGFNNGNVLLFVGSLGYGPNGHGLRWFIEKIFPRFRECYPDGKLIVVGRTPDRETRRLCAGTAGVKLYADAPDIKEYYQKCRAVVVPILAGGGTRIKILEAALAGRPVISTPAGADGLDLTAGEELLLFSDDSEFMNEYGRLLHQDRYCSIVIKARNAVKEKYCVARFSGAMEKVIRHLDNKAASVPDNACIEGNFRISLSEGETEAGKAPGKPHTDVSGPACNLCGHRRPREMFVKENYSLVQCTSCGLFYVSNAPTEKEIQRMYSFNSNYHTGLNDDTKRFQKYFRTAGRHLMIIERHKREGRLLDVGCSAGFFLKMAKDHGWETHGLEISPDTAQLARRRYGLDVSVGCLTENAFQEDYFDVVTLWDVLEHLRDPFQGLLYINRILKDEAIVVFSTPSIDGLFPRMSYKIAKIINYWPHPEPPYHLFQFSRDTLRMLLEKTGFNVLEICDERIPVSYSFGTIKTHIRYPQRLLYSACFIPLALLGPLFHRGDSLIVVARKARRQPVDSAFGKREQGENALIPFVPDDSSDFPVSPGTSIRSACEPPAIRPCY